MAYATPTPKCTECGEPLNERTGTYKHVAYGLVDGKLQYATYDRAEDVYSPLLTTYEDDAWIPERDRMLKRIRWHRVGNFFKGLILAVLAVLIVGLFAQFYHTNFGLAGSALTLIATGGVGFTFIDFYRTWRV